MFLLSWILLFCTAVSLSSAGFCPKKYACGKSCKWFRCSTKYCYENVCCPGFCGTDCTTDIDECSEGHHGCMHPATCENSHGSYSCVCPAGYILQSDKKTCEGHWCNETYICYKTCTSTNCTGGWWGGKRCSSHTFACKKNCTKRVCCSGWTGHDCHIAVGK